jgi:hypothetical protein
MDSILLFPADDATSVLAYSIFNMEKYTQNNLRVLIANAAAEKSEELIRQR